MLALSGKKRRLRKLQLDRRRENVRLNRSVRKVQTWFRRAISARSAFLSWSIESTSYSAIQGVLEFAVHQCIEFYKMNSATDIPMASQACASTELSLRHTRNVLHIDQCNCQYIFVKRDTTEYRLHIFILCGRSIIYFVVYLTKRISAVRSNPLLTNNCSRIHIDPRKLQLMVRGFDSDYFSFVFCCRESQTITFGNTNRPLMPISNQTRFHYMNGPRMLQAALDSDQVCQKAYSCSNASREAAVKLTQTIKITVARYVFRRLNQWKFAVCLQRMCRGFIVRRRLVSIRSMDFYYVDSDLENMLGASIVDLVNFDDTESFSDWNPCRPTISTPTQYLSSTNEIVGAEPDPPEVNIESESVSEGYTTAICCQKPDGM